MKKVLCLFLVVLAALLCMGGALAAPEDTAGTAHMPTEVRNILEKKWAGCTVTGWANPAGEMTSTACGFAAINHRGSNILVAFGYKGGQWKYLWKNDDAGAQGRDVTLTLLDDGGENGVSYFVILEQGVSPTSTVWVKDRKTGAYLLTQVIRFDTDGESVLASQQVTDSKVTYTGWLTEGRTLTCRGTVQRDLQHFSYRAFPQTPEKMRKKLTVAPEIPASDALYAEEIRFSGGKKYAVYSAPDDRSLRAGKGKATVSTNGWIQVFGEEDGWVLVQYAIDSEHYRFGYIPAKALPARSVVQPLAFRRTMAWTGAAVSVTDDPLFSHSPLATLPAGCPVTWLATMGDWAYIGSSTGDLLRGFIPLSALETDRRLDLAGCPDANGPVYEGQLTVRMDGSFSAAFTICQAGSLGNAAVTAVRLCDPYGNILCTATVDGNGQASAVTGRLPAGTTCIRFVAVDPLGNVLNDAVSVEW